MYFKFHFLGCKEEKVDNLFLIKCSLRQNFFHVFQAMNMPWHFIQGLFYWWTYCRWLSMSCIKICFQGHLYFTNVKNFYFRMSDLEFFQKLTHKTCSINEDTKRYFSIVCIRIYFSGWKMCPQSSLLIRLWLWLWMIFIMLVTTLRWKASWILTLSVQYQC